MKFKIKKNVFLKSLMSVQGIVEKKHTLPILANVLIEAKANKIIMTATDLEVGLCSKFDADIIEEGKVTISAKKLYEIIKELPDSTINFLSKENYWAEITCNKSIFNLVGLSPEEFPKFPEKGMDNEIISKKLLNEMIDKTLFSVSNDDTKFNLTGIHVKSELRDNINYLNFVSTDGHRLSLIKREVDIKNTDIFENGFILPRKGIVELKKNLENMEKNVQISINDNNFSISDDKMTLIMRMIDGEFPDYKRVIPEIGNNSALINRSELLEALKRISVLSNEKSKGFKCNIKNNYLELTSSNPELGDAKEEIEIEYEGDDISIGFNARYIIDILSVIEENNIILNLKDNISPGRINPENDTDFLAVIMPMRL
jgi:DNA polymerase-3 subunit beta